MIRQLIKCIISLFSKVRLYEYYEDQFPVSEKNLIVSIVKGYPKLERNLTVRKYLRLKYAIRFSFLTSHKHHTLEM